MASKIERILDKLAQVLDDVARGIKRAAGPDEHGGARGCDMTTTDTVTSPPTDERPDLPLTLYTACAIARGELNWRDDPIATIEAASKDVSVRGRVRHWYYCMRRLPTSQTWESVVVCDSLVQEANGKYRFSICRC